MKKALVCGAGGFIGGHLVTRLKNEGYWVQGVDLKFHEFKETDADDFIQGDLRDPVLVNKILSENTFDEVYQLAADMGGAGFIFTGENDADLMHNSAMINLNFAHASVKHGVKRIFYSSSACMYPEGIQLETNNPGLSEDMAYPANPDSEYGWEKLFSERIFLAFHKNYDLNVRIGRFHNIFGPLGTWTGGREKAPAAMCRKVAEAPKDGSIEVWGDGEQTRSFLYIDECIEGIRKLMASECIKPLNIGSDEIVSINKLVEIVSNAAQKDIKINHIDGPLGVRGRNSENSLIKQELGWAPSQTLTDGIAKTYAWVESQVNEQKK